MRKMIAVLAVVCASAVLGGCAGGIGGSSMLPNAPQSIQHAIHHAGNAGPTTVTLGPTPATITMGPTPATVTMGPTPATITMGPTPATVTMGPTPATVTMGPTPATITMGPTPAARRR